MNISCDGLVLYTDGSFRRQQAGWGVHGYAYVNAPLPDALGAKQLPTKEGYQVVELSQTVTPSKVIDAYGPVTKNPTNNTGELQGVISAFELAMDYSTNNLVMLMDSEYVRKNIPNIPRWIKSNWLKADGTPYANQDYWKTLTAAKTAWEDLGRKVEFKWVKGHSGELGNERADANANLGSGGKPSLHSEAAAPSVEKYKGQELHPLIMKARMLFTLDASPPTNDGYYYLYHLGRLHKYGHKQDDSELDKIRKTDLILGRRNSEACFSVFKANTPQTYLETLKGYHAAHHRRNVIDLGVVRLDVAYKASTQERLTALGDGALVNLEQLKALVTAQDELVSITLDPPRMAREAVAQFNLMRRRLDETLEKRLGQGMFCLDVTDLLYEKVSSGKKDVNKLHKTITSATQFLERKADINGVAVTLRMVLGLDIPNRNALAKIAALEPKVSVLVVADGPVSYSFSTVFETSDGAAIFQAPYANYILKI